jgi:crotonobetainyl-CoA:carnitine CoA-transferase CaiB-like acyl-CoA transferase
MRHHLVTPYGPYLAKDCVYVSLAVGTDQAWEVFCRQVVERPEWLEDDRFKTVETRCKNRGVLEDLVEKAFLEYPHEEWLRRLEKSRLPYGEVRGIAQVLAHPQVVARRMIREVESPVGSVPVIASPLRLSESPARYGPIPALGGDTEAILRELGFSAAEVEELNR